MKTDLWIMETGYNELWKKAVANDAGERLKVIEY